MAKFAVYGVTFDADVFGLYATCDEARAQIDNEENGAWEDCEVKRFVIQGTPEVID